MKQFRAKTAVLGLFFTMMVAAIASAQNASVSGTVQDSSGAAVAAATVTITNLATTVSRHATTSNTGIYRIEPLAPGDYSLTVEKEGFRSVNVDKLTLTVDQKFTFNTTLGVGEVSTKVEVNADAVGAVDTETATLSNVIDQKQMADLPLILRDPYQLVLLGPGVTQSDGFGGASATTTSNLMASIITMRTCPALWVGLAPKTPTPHRNFAFLPTTSLPNMDAITAPSSTS